MEIAENRHKTVWTGTESLWPSLNGVLALQEGVWKTSRISKVYLFAHGSEKFQRNKKLLILVLTHIGLILRVAVLKNN